MMGDFNPSTPADNGKSKPGDRDRILAPDVLIDMPRGWVSMEVLDLPFAEIKFTIPMAKAYNLFLGQEWKVHTAKGDVQCRVVRIAPRAGKDETEFTLVPMILLADRKDPAELAAAEEIETTKDTKGHEG